MISSVISRLVVLLTALALLAGCAEFDRRGGVVAEVEDVILFSAHTKSHRLFRSYLLAGVLLAAARQSGHNETDKEAIASALGSALAVAFEAYECLYRDQQSAPAVAPDWIAQSTADVGTINALGFPQPTVCQFFDEKMARLDYALYRLALVSLFNEQARAQLSTIRDKLIGEVPVLSPAAKSAIFGVKAISQATNVVDDLLNLSFSSLGPVLALLPLYRDSLEMNMWVIVDSLTKACPVETGIELLADMRPKPAAAMNCQTLAYARHILYNGNGNLPDWREFVRQMNYAGVSIEAYQAHFALVTRLIWRSCSNLMTGTDCALIFKAAIEKAIKQSLQVNFYSGKVVDPNYLIRTYSASAPLPSRLARRREAPAVATPLRAVQPQDPASTGSVDRNPTTPVKPP